ncbi:C39 family peptidase [Lawsonibacter sp. JLR.KK007]|uniref:C39 family peptidase n=1 Tax=Lawsonibacter sp. JLR.KK007 TaxID=3114293 RepID=UPI002FF28ED0
MNKKPVSYLQTDPRWKSKPYRVKGESATIGGSGCGPTAAAMIIETMTGKKYTPEDACNWSMAHGYKALGNGTYYGYFKPQFAEFGIDCDMLNWTKTYGKPDHANHKKVFEMLKQGYYFIALMGPGLWTTGGHFVVLWWEDGKVRINDPASTKDARLNGDLKTFKSQVSYYWWIDARKFNGYGSAVKPPVASTGTPGTVKPPANGPKVGDIVEFTGSAHYYSANATKSSPCKPGKAEVTQAFNGKHPYHLIAVKGGGSTVYGWVDAADIAVEASAAIAKGSTVKVKAGAKTYTGGGLASFVYANTYTVLELSGDRAVIGQGKAVTAAVNIKDLTLVG